MSRRPVTTGGLAVYKTAVCMRAGVFANFSAVFCASLTGARPWLGFRFVCCYRHTWYTTEAKMSLDGTFAP